MEKASPNRELPPFGSEEKIRSDWLETFPYQGPRQTIEYYTKEFSAVCPFSGLPDLADVWIDYIPNKLVVELKSLKYYFVSFRQVGVYQEPATARIYTDIHRLLKPHWLSVKTRYSTRGGINAVCQIRSDQQSSSSPSKLSFSHTQHHP